MQRSLTGCATVHLPHPPPQYPTLHFLASEAAALLGLELAPELFEHPAACRSPHPVALLHVPHVSSAGLATALTRTPRGRLPRLPDGTFGWRRRGVLLLATSLAAMAEGRAAGGVAHSFPGTRSLAAAALDGEPLYSPAELQALMAAALAPMCLPGGGGWRLDTQDGSEPGVQAGNQGVGPRGALAVADAVSAVVLADAAPQSLVGRLPVQLSAKWERLYRVLSRVAVGCVAAGDRAALCVVQALEPCVTAVGARLGPACCMCAGGRVASLSALITQW